MKSKTIFVTLVLCFVGAGLCYAADGFLGTWKLNEGKSKLSPAMAKNSTVVYEAAGDSVKVTIDGTGTDGKPAHNEWTGKYDGKEYPVTGDPSSDTRALTKVDDHTMKLSVKKGGKEVLGGNMALSADGKTRTITVSGTDAKGNKFSSTAVYDKQ